MSEASVRRIIMSSFPSVADDPMIPMMAAAMFVSRVWNSGMSIFRLACRSEGLNTQVRGLQACKQPVDSDL